MTTEQRAKEIGARLNNGSLTTDELGAWYREDVKYILTLLFEQRGITRELESALNAIVFTGTKGTSTIFPERSLATCVEIARAALGEGKEE